MPRTNIDLDAKLVKEGLARTHCRTKKDLVHLALRQLLLRERRKDILALAGKIRWKGDLHAWREDRV
jgi:Arc/MetJ family transcription regulator